MSFLNNLVKGFVRSAVNQVGRDGGKVISNNLYGDNHSTPLRETEQNREYINKYADIPPENNRINLLSAGFKAEILKNGIIGNIFIFIGTFILPYVGTVYWLIIGIKNIFKTKTRFYGYEKQSQYKSDRRFKTGVRHIGFKKVKVYSTQKAKAVNSERVIYISKGIIAFIFAYISFSFWNGMFENRDSKEQVEIEIIQPSNIGVIRKNSELKKEPNENSKIILSIPVNDTVTLLNDNVINQDSTKIWYKIKYRDKEGWIYNTR